MVLRYQSGNTEIFGSLNLFTQSEHLDYTKTIHCLGKKIVLKVARHNVHMSEPMGFLSVTLKAV